MSEVVIYTQNQLDQPDLSNIPTTDLRKMLADAVGVTASALARLAGIWTELERRGEDLSALRGGLFSYLPLIADGRLLPELVVRCAGQAMLLKTAQSLSITEQQQILERGITIVDITDDGRIEEKSVRPEDIPASKIRIAFDGSGIRTPAEQARLLSPRKSTQETKRGIIVKVSLTRDEYDILRKKAGGARVATYLRDIGMKDAK